MLPLWPWLCHEVEMRLDGWYVGEGTREERDVGVDALDVVLGFSWLGSPHEHVTESRILKSEETQIIDFDMLTLLLHRRLVESRVRASYI